MPIRLPTLDRVQPAEPSPEGQITAQPVDVVAAGSAATKAADRTADNLMRVFNKAQTDAYNSKIAELGHQLDRFARQKLEGDPDQPGTGLRHLRGNPDEPYAKFDDELAAKRDELLANSNLQGKYLEKARGRLNSRYNSAYNTSLMYYGAQRSNYRSELADSSVDIAKRDAMTALSFYQPKEPQTLGAFNNSLDAIREARLDEGEANQTIQEVPSNFQGPKYRRFDDDGNEYYVAISEPVRAQISKDISEATYESINALVKAGQIGKAETLMNQYGDFIDPVNQAKLEETFDKKKIEVKAYEQLGKLADIPSKQRREKLRALPAKTARQSQIKNEAMKLLDAQIRYQENEKNRASDHIYNQVANQIRNMTDPDTAGEKFIDNTVMLEKTPVVVDGVEAPLEEFLPDITKTSQVQALYKMVEEPSKKGDSLIYAKRMQEFKDGTLGSVPFAELQVDLAKLSKRQRNNVEGLWEQLNRKEGPDNNGYRSFVRKAELNGILRKGRSGSYTGTSRDRMEKLDELYRLQVAPQLRKGMSKDEVEQLLNQEIRDNRDELMGNQGNWFVNKAKGLLGMGDDEEKQKQVSKPVRKALPPSKFQSLGWDEQMQIYNAYKKKTGKTSSQITTQEIEEYYKSLGEDNGSE